MQKTCGRPHACDQAPTSIPIPGISSLTNRTVEKRENFALKHHLCNVQGTFEKCEKMLTEWMCNLQTRSFVLPNAFGCIFCYIQIWFAKCK